MPANAECPNCDALRRELAEYKRRAEVIEPQLANARDYLRDKNEVIKSLAAELEAARAALRGKDA